MPGKGCYSDSLLYMLNMIQDVIIGAHRIFSFQCKQRVYSHTLYNSLASNRRKHEKQPIMNEPTQMVSAHSEWVHSNCNCKYWVKWMAVHLLWFELPSSICHIFKLYIENIQDLNYMIMVIHFNWIKPGPQSRTLCGAVCALSIAIVLY